MRTHTMMVTCNCCQLYRLCTWLRRYAGRGVDGNAWLCKPCAETDYPGQEAHRTDGIPPRLAASRTSK
jgi:hypothetical protein